MRFILVFFYIMVSSEIFTQSYEYKISSFQDKYTEIDSFNSILLETRGNQSWEKKFNLNFSFPFYDSIYNHIICENTSACLFDHSLDYEIVLMGFGYDFDISEIDTNYIVSDVRYKLEKVNGLRALVIQYTKVRLNSDSSVNEFDSHLNFQVWFFESGSMEVRFGTFNLANSPNYIPGEGFYLIPINHEPINLGPEMIIRNSFKDDVGIGLDGLYDDYIVDNFGGYLTSMPPEGWVIRFERVNKTNNLDYVRDDIKIYPNPTKGIIGIENFDEIIELQIVNIHGISQNFIKNENGIDIQTFDPGVYILKLTKNTGSYLKKFIKI